MPFELYRRHVRTCPERPKGRNSTSCLCPVWVDGPHPVNGRRVRRSVGTRDWQRAKRLLDRWESDIKAGEIEALRIPALAGLVADYLRDCRVRKLAAASLQSYAKTLQHFISHCPHPANEIGVAEIAAWRDARAISPGRKHDQLSAHSLRKEIEAVRVFCEYLVTRGLLTSNPARKVRAPRNDDPPTLPFSKDDVKKLLTAADRIDNNNDAGIERARVRARALILLLLYSGMRISDAIQLERSRVDPEGRLMVRMMKTRSPLYVRLPTQALEALKAVPVESQYFLWTGKSKLSTAVGSARRTIDCLGRIAEIDAHPHRFRDTFSVELLKSGADLRTVQLLLGHTSIRTTEKHYAPWVQDFQRQLDRATAKLKFG